MYRGLFVQTLSSFMFLIVLGRCLLPALPSPPTHPRSRPSAQRVVRIQRDEVLLTIAVQRDRSLLRSAPLRCCHARRGTSETSRRLSAGTYCCSVGASSFVLAASAVLAVASKHTYYRYVRSAFYKKKKRSKLLTFAFGHNFFVYFERANNLFPSPVIFPATRVFV